MRVGLAIFTNISGNGYVANTPNLGKNEQMQADAYLLVMR
jgi:hypothetical protein